MRSLTRYCVLLICVLAATASAQTTDTSAQQDQAEQARQKVESLEEPLYNPFIERYVLDELKQLRQDMANQKVELVQSVVDRDLMVSDKAMSYASNTVTYFFYLIAGVSSILVIVGWTSIRDIRDKVHSVADKEVQKLVTTYEQRLRAIEQQLTQKTQHIHQNRVEIEKTQELHSLWLRAAQEHSHANKVHLYDEILRLHPGDCEAMTYKADTILEMGEPHWAKDLCRQALDQDPEYGYAHYQLACANAALHRYDEAIASLRRAISISESFIAEAVKDPALQELTHQPEFSDLMDNGEEVNPSTAVPGADHRKQNPANKPAR